MCSSSSSIPELERNLPSPYSADEEPPLSLWRPKTSDDSDDEDTWAPVAPGEKTSDHNRFKVLPFEFSPRGKITPKLRIKGRPDPRFDDSAVRLLSPKVINRLGQELGWLILFFGNIIFFVKLHRNMPSKNRTG